MAGEAICSLGYSEPGSRIRCVRGPVQGDAAMATAGASTAPRCSPAAPTSPSYVLMLTRTNPDVPKHKGLTMFIVPLKAEGIDDPAGPHLPGRAHEHHLLRRRAAFPTVIAWARSTAACKTMSGAASRSSTAAVSPRPSGRCCRRPRNCAARSGRNGRPLIEETDAQMRLARPPRNLPGLRSDCHTARCGRARRRCPTSAYGPMAKLFSSEKFLTDARDLLDLTAPHSLSKREGPAGLPQPVLSPRAGHDDLRRHQRSPSQHDCRARARSAAHARAKRETAQ